MQIQIGTPTPSTPPTAEGAPAAVYIGGPGAIWQGGAATRRELDNQRVGLQDQRRDIAQQLRDPMVRGADRQGLEQQIVALDARIAALDKELAANTRREPVTLVPGMAADGWHEPGRPYVEGSVLTAMFIVCVLFPLSVALALRFVRRGAATVAALPREMMERFDRLDQAVDAMAVEVERIGESQRFVTRLIGERPALERERLS